MRTDIAGVILAGGLSRRMGGGDKPLVAVAGKTLLERTIERLAPQVGTMLLNANGDPARFDRFGLQVAADVIQGHAGPLVGVLTGLEWARAQGRPWVLSAAADTPLFPTDLAERLMRAVAAEGADMAMAVTGDQSHPVFALWPVGMADNLRRAVEVENVRKIEAFTDRYKVALVDWPSRPVDPFFNVNTPEDVMRLSMILAGTLPAEAPVKAARPVAVVVERKDSANPWVTETWRPLDLVLDPPPAADWVELRRGAGFEHYLAQAPVLELHRSDLASYRYNLAGAQPQVFVVLRRDEGRARPRVVLVTAAPDEAQSMSESGEDLVEGLPMPQEVEDWALMFCACHPPEQPMKKRRRDRYDSDRAFTPRERRP